MAALDKDKGGRASSPLLPHGAHDEKRALSQPSGLSQRLQGQRPRRWTNTLIAASLAITIATFLFVSSNRSSTSASASSELYVSFSSHFDAQIAASSRASVYAQVPDYDGIATLSWSDATGSDEAAGASRAASLPAKLLQGPEDGRLVWLTREVVEESVLSRRPDVEVKLLCEPPLHDREQFASLSRDNCSEAQAHASHSPYVDAIFEDHVAPCNLASALHSATPQSQPTTIVLLRTKQSSLLFVPHSRLATLDQCLPPFIRPYLLPPLTSTDPIASPASTAAEDDKPEPSYPSPRLDDPFVSTWIRSPLLQSRSRIQQDLDALTGENASTPLPLPGKPRWTTRHSSTYGGYEAATWLLKQQRANLGLEGAKGELLEHSKHGARCDLWTYGDGSFNPDVVCIIPGQKGESSSDDDDSHQEGAVILSAHYDSRGSFGSPIAPGGDDDGSGTSMLLAVSRVLGQALSTKSSARRRPLHLLLFSGEEQGLVGSKYYAAHLRKQGIPIRLALQTDMVAYHVPGEPLQLALPASIGTRSAATFVRRTAQIWAPQLVLGETAVCCSDHQSFWEQGFPATQVFERNGPIADPRYHDSGDVVRRVGYDLEQLVVAGQVVLAGAMQLLWE